MKAISRPLPDIQSVLSQLNYDMETGLFTRIGPKRGPGRNKPHAGYSQKTGYIAITIDGREVLAHRLAWLVSHGLDPAEHQIDHINGNRTDNRIANLRLATAEGNARNAKIRKDNTSGVKGITLRESGKWCARVRSYGKALYKQFSDLEEAKNFIIATRLQAHGAFSKHE